MAPKPEEVVVNGIAITLNKEDESLARTNNNNNNGNGFINNAFYGDESLVPSKLEKASIDEKSAGTASGSSEPSMDFDDLLPHIGEFGTYQKILFLLMIPFAFAVAFVYFTQIFITLVPEQHWCRVPELEHLSLEDRYVKRFCCYLEASIYSVFITCDLIFHLQFCTAAQAVSYSCRSR